ncbi:hypothetical protein NDU88_001383 [Pleurodeles waltl]|uniref:Uncharacterized protein n=1 Tax=Pleurodeles waltl TaxID=8319 RepID=A0AAV7SZD5_PLEWA|nr:hypothetical protein NDU88_001383 [Pleurodeles waltl]
MFVAPKPHRKPHPRSGRFRGVHRGGGIALCVLRGTGGGSDVRSRLSGKLRTPRARGVGGEERWVLTGLLRSVLPR